MYYFIYDAAAQSKQFYKEMVRIESRLVDIGIHDKVVKLSPLRSLREAVSDAYKRGFETIVAVGEDALLTQTINLIAGFSLACGTIPIGKQTTLAHYLGVESGVKACDILSNRKVEMLDLARCNEVYFIGGVSLPARQYHVECDREYTMQFDDDVEVSVVNLGYPPKPFFDGSVVDPQDGLLNIYFSPKKRSLFTARTKPVSNIQAKRVVFETQTKNTFATIDYTQPSSAPLSIEITKNTQRFIVGKKRIF